MNLKEKFDAGYEIHASGDGTKAVQVIKSNSMEDVFFVEFINGTIFKYNPNEIIDCLICTPPKKRVKQLLRIDDKGIICSSGHNVGVVWTQIGSQETELTTEQQPDGTWKIV